MIVHLSMQNKFFVPIFLFIGLSMLGIVGMQYYWIQAQYKDRKEALVVDSQRVIRSVNDYLSDLLHGKASIDDDKLDELDFFYESPDSNFNLLFERITKVRNKDGSSHSFNLPLLQQRIKQMNQFIEANQAKKGEISLEDRKDVEESFIILYAQERKSKDQRKAWDVLVEDFKIDSCIQHYLQEYNIHVPYQYGIFDPEKKQWMYLSEQADSTTLATSAFQGDLFDDAEQLHLHLEKTSAYLWKTLSYQLVLTGILIFLILLSFFYLLSVIWKQKKLSAITSDFINNMTHEFKTPLATIDFAVANINNPVFIKKEDMVRQFTQVIKDESKRMNTQVELVLNAALADQQAFELKQEPFDIHELLQQLSDSMQLKIKASKGTLQLFLNASNATFLGDQQHITSMFSNILDNAYKYSPEDVQISVTTKNTKAGIQIDISDQGIGMSKETVQKIFDKFYRVPTGNLHNIKGFGLGLNYAKAIAEQHQGDIKVNSQIDKGSTFSIFLPQKPSNA